MAIIGARELAKTVAGVGVTGAVLGGLNRTDEPGFQKQELKQTAAITGIFAASGALAGVGTFVMGELGQRGIRNNLALTALVSAAQYAAIGGALVGSYNLVD